MELKLDIDKGVLKKALIELLENTENIPELIQELKDDKGDGIGYGKFSSTLNVRWALDVLETATADSITTQ